MGSCGVGVLKVVGCIVEQHDLWLVGLAALVCTLAAGTCIALLRHADRSKGRLHYLWLGVAAVAGGFGIWATHFIAMLAFEPGLPSGYHLGLTALSLVYAIVLTGLGLTLAQLRSLPAAPVLGGIVLGGGIAAMHYTGMVAYEVAGHVQWDPSLVAASLVLGSLLGAAGLSAALADRGRRGTVLGAFLLLLAICSHHFTAMGAVTILPDPTVDISDGAIPSRWLAVGVACASLAILFLACAALALDIRDRRRFSLERERLHSLANAAVEGLVVCQGNRIVNANDSFGTLVGLPAGDLSGIELSRFLPDVVGPLSNGQPDQAVETELVCVAGGTVPVELIVRPVTYGNRPHYAVAVRDLRARRRAEGQIQFLAYHDPLTGLANRASFRQRLDQELKVAQAAKRKLAVLCLDLDRFKEVNDLFGHPTGDAMLVNVARSVTAILNETQMMARLGGDEFAILVPCEHAVEAGRIAEQVIEALRAGIGETTTPTIATSVGIALYPDDAEERSLLLSYADTALYKAKSEGRGTYRFFEARLGMQVRDRRMLEHDLRHAVARGEMQLVYQPQTDVQSGAVLGFEVLLRWHHPDRGAVPPSLSSRSPRRAARSCRSGSGSCARLAGRPRLGQIRFPSPSTSRRCRSMPPTSCSSSTKFCSRPVSSRSVSRSRSRRRRSSVIRGVRNRPCGSSRRSVYGSRWTISEPVTRPSRISAPIRSTRSRSTVPSSDPSMRTNRPRRSCDRFSASGADLACPFWPRVSRRRPNSHS